MKSVYTGMMAAVMIAAATLTFTACSSEAEELLLPDVPEQTATNQSYTLTVNASKGEDGTRALSLSNDGNDIKATWAQGDVVKVYKGNEEVGTLKAQNGGANTTLTGTLNEGVSLNLEDALTLKYLSDDYSTQEGTLEYIASHCDYATATVNVSSVTDDGKISTTDAEFENQQAIVKFTLKDKNGTEINPTSFSVKYGDESIEINNISEDTYTTNDAGVLYVAIPGGEAQDVVLKANVESTVYTFMRHNVKFDNANYYPINVKMKWDELENPLTFEAKEAGATVTLTKGNITTLSFQYSTDGINWSEYTSGTAITLTNIGDKVMFRGSNKTLSTGLGTTTSTIISGTGECYVYGNVMSLLYEDKFAGKTNFPEGSDNSLAGLFYGNTTIFNHPSKTLVLPAITMTNYCYGEMFLGCTNLTTAPELPATTLAVGCYKGMFQGCTSLTTAPDLLAETGATSCYQSMFYECRNLNSVRCYINPNGTNTYTSTWLYHVAKTGTVYTKSGTNWITNSNGGIPSDWKRVNE